MFVYRWRGHAKWDRAVHIRHHAGSRGHTHGRWLRGVQTFQNQESPVRYHGIKDSLGIVDTLKNKNKTKKLSGFRFDYYYNYYLYTINSFSTHSNNRLDEMIIITFFKKSFIVYIHKINYFIIIGTLSTRLYTLSF